VFPAPVSWQSSLLILSILSVPESIRSG
jgi:hypothetical protein